MHFVYISRGGRWLEKDHFHVLGNPASAVAPRKQNALRHLRPETICPTPCHRCQPPLSPGGTARGHFLAQYKLFSSYTPVA